MLKCMHLDQEIKVKVTSRCQRAVSGPLENTGKDTQIFQTLKRHQTSIEGQTISTSSMNRTQD